MNRYPIYVPSKSRYQYDRALTARTLAEDGVPFYLAVESKEVDAYRELCRRIDVPEEWVLDVGFDDLRQGAAPARNWICDHARAGGHARHWELDDNSYRFYRLYRGQRIPCEAGLALRVCEDFTDRYENVGLSGLNYFMFGVGVTKPFFQNVRIYSCILVNGELPYLWRGPYNADTDMSLQVLSGGWCTILLNTFLIFKMPAFQGAGTAKRSMDGGMTDMYVGDGRAAMARCLERKWPYVVETTRRFGRPQHRIMHSNRFDTPLRLRPDVDLSVLPAVDEYGQKLVATDDLKSERLRQMVDEYNAE